MNASEVALRRMRNTRLIGPPFKSAPQVVAWLGAVQAQDYGPAQWSIGQRAHDLVDHDIDRAVADGSIIRTHVLRPTWHFAAREDIRWLLALTAPRIQRKNERRYLELGLDPSTRTQCESLITSALEGGNHLTREGIAGVLQQARIDHSGQRLPYILSHCELEAAICSGGRAGRHHTYANFDERVPETTLSADDALVELVTRYLQSHGPATVADLRWWSSLTVTEINRALDMLGPAARSQEIEDFTFWCTETDANTPADPRQTTTIDFLQAYDELIVGYTESRFFGDPHGPAARAATKERKLPTGLILMNGRLLGHWRRTIERKEVRVEALVFDTLKPVQRRALEAEVADLGRFLALPPRLEVGEM